MSYRLRKEQLEKTFRPREEWWSRVFASPIAHYILLFIADKKLITPNRLTLISFGLTFFTAAIIISGVKGSLLLAAIILQFAYIVDCMDGQLARYRQTSSKFGSFFDKWSDYVKFPFVLFALIIRSLNEKYSIFVLSTGILSIFLICYLPYLRILTKAEFSIHPWNVFSNKNFKQRNLRFFLFEEAQWYLIVSVGLLFSSPESAIITLVITQTGIALAQTIRVFKLLYQPDVTD